jgi:hypothetical protein
MDLPLGQYDMFFQATKYSQILSSPYGNDVCGMFFRRRRVRTAQWWDEGIGASGGHMGSNARARRSLAIDNHVSFMSTLGARLEATQDGGGSQPEERHGLAAEVLRIIRRQKNPVRGAFGKYSRAQHLLWRGDSIPVSDLPLP